MLSFSNCSPLTKQTRLKPGTEVVTLSCAKPFPNFDIVFSPKFSTPHTILFFKGAQVGGEPGIFLIFVYFLSQAAP